MAERDKSGLLIPKCEFVAPKGAIENAQDGIALALKSPDVMQDYRIAKHVREGFAISR